MKLQLSRKPSEDHMVIPVSGPVPNNHIELNHDIIILNSAPMINPPKTVSAPMRNAIDKAIRLGLTGGAY